MPAIMRLGKILVKHNVSVWYTVSMDETLIDRFWARVDKKGPDECWNWLGYIDKKGYGSLSHKGKNISTHVVSFEIANGYRPASKGLHTDHLCRNRACANPNHLEAVSPAVNLMRGENQGALNKVKTHCPRGHAYDIFRTNKRGTTFRWCKTCERARAAQNRAIAKAEISK